MMTIDRRRFLILTGSLGGITATSLVLASCSPTAGSPPLLDQLDPSGQLVGAELIALGRTINSTSPEAAARTSKLLERRDQAGAAQAIIDAVRDGSNTNVVTIDGWELPELVAGVAGILASDAP